MNEHPRIKVYGRMLGCLAVDTAGKSRMNAGNRMHTSERSGYNAAKLVGKWTTSEIVHHSCYM